MLFRSKIKYACALSQMASPDEMINVPGVGERPSRELSRQALADVVEPRYDELFHLIQAEIRHSGYADVLAAGLVFTGGTSKMEGVVELAEEIFHLPVRIGMPTEVQGLTDIVKNPTYSTGVGLLMYGMKHMQQQQGRQPEREPVIRILEKVKKFFIRED